MCGMGEHALAFWPCYNTINRSGFAKQTRNHGDLDKDMLRNKASQLFLPFVIASSVALTGCMSNNDGEELRNQLFKAQKRLLQLEETVERAGEETKSSGSRANQKIATTDLRLNKIDNDFMKIQGELDTLKRGVITGELPGMEQQPDSVAKAISGLEERIGELEKTQMEILVLLKSKKAKKSRKRLPLKNISDLKKAYEKKQYLYVVEDAQKIISSLKEEKLNSEARFLYAESLFKLGRLRDAALRFNQLASESVPEGKGSHIAYRLGDCFRLLGDKKAATLFYNEVIKKFPESDEAEAARDQLKKTETNGS